MAQSHFNEGPLPTMVPPEMKVETPPKYSWIEESKLVRRLFLEDRILRLTPIARRCLRIDPGTELLVEPMKQYRSSGSRLIARKDSFKITVLDKQYHFSVKVDTGRGYAIASQKATMDLIRQKTSVFRVPHVLGYDTSDDNELGRSWIMREYIPGEGWNSKWKALSAQQKQAIAQSLARYTAQLYNIRFDKIGNLVYEDDIEIAPPSIHPPESWNPHFGLWCYFWAWLLWIGSAFVSWVRLLLPRISSPARINNIVVGKLPIITSPGLPTGPFTNAHDWFQSRLQQTIRKTLVLAETCGHAYDLEGRVISEALRWAKALHYRGNMRQEEKINTIHHPIKESSILIAEDGELAGLLDWDDISVCPLWAVNAVPDALLSEANETALTIEEFVTSQSPGISPVDQHTIAEAHAETIAHLAITKSDLDDPANEAHYPYPIVLQIRQYWKQLEDYEKTKMRGVFHATMSDLAPDWVHVHSTRKWDTRIATSVRDVTNGIARYYRHFESDLNYAQLMSETTETTWSSDDDTAYNDSDVEDDR